MSSHDVGLNFILKRPKNRDEEKRYVYLRITLNGNVSDYSTQVMVNPENWDPVTKRVYGKNADAPSLNKHLETLIFRCRNIKTEFLYQGKHLTASMIKSILQGRDEDHITLLKFFEEHNNRLKRQVVAGEYSLGTFQKYTIAMSHVRKFLKDKRALNDILLRSLDYPFVEDYALWLKEIRGCSGNTTAKYISNLKKIVLYAIKRGLLSLDPFSGFKVKRKEVLIIPLTLEELQVISKKYFRLIG